MSDATDKLSDFLTKWWRPISILFAACYFAFTAYDDINDNSSTNDSQEIAIEDSKELFNVEFKTLDNRGKKRYDRLLDALNEAEAKIEQLQKEVAFLQGQIHEGLYSNNSLP